MTGQPAAAEAFCRSYRHRVRYHEIDAQAVVYNAHYLTYFDIALTEFVRPTGLILASKAERFDFHVVHASVDYKAPIHLDDVIEIGVRIARVGRSSVTFALAAFPDAQDQMLATGTAVWVWSDLVKGGSVALPEKIKQQLSSLGVTG